MTEEAVSGRKPSPANIGGRSLLVALALCLCFLVALFGVLHFFGRPIGAVLGSASLTDLTFGLTAYAGIFIAMWLALAATGRKLPDIGFRHCDASLYGIGIFLALLWIGVTSAIYSAAGQWELSVAAGSKLIQPFLGDNTSLLLLMIMAGPVAALVEEALFRGMIYGWLRKHLGIALSAIISSIVFTAMHFYVYVAGLAFVFEMLMLSVLLALLFELSRSLWPGILCHAVNNLSLIAIYLFGL